MFFILFITGFIAASSTESAVGKLAGIETYDYAGANYGAYSHGKSEPTESSAASGVIVSDSGFSPSDARYTIASHGSTSHDTVNSPSYLSSPYPTHSSTKYSSPVQYTAAYEKSYNSAGPYTSSSSTSGIYSSPKSYSSASYSPASSNHVDSLGYSSASSPSLSGFTGSTGALGDYGSHGSSGLGLRGYATTTTSGGAQGVSRGASVGDYPTSGYLTSGGLLSGSGHSSLGGHATASHIGSNYAGYAATASALSSHVDPTHGYATQGAHVVPGTTISYDYSVNDGDVNYAATNEAQRYTAPSHSSDLSYKDTGYSTGSPSIYGSLKHPYVPGFGGHLAGYNAAGTPIYVRSVDSPSHGHYSRYEFGPSIGYSSKSSLPHVPSLHSGSPTKIIYVKDSSFGSSYPLGLSSLKSKLYGLHSHGSPAYVAAPTSGLLPGYLSRGYGISSHSPYLSYS